MALLGNCEKYKTIMSTLISGESLFKGTATVCRSLINQKRRNDHERTIDQRDTAKNAAVSQQ